MYQGGGAFCTVTPYLSIEFAENWGCYFRYVTKTKYLLKSNLWKAILKGLKSVKNR